MGWWHLATVCWSSTRCNERRICCVPSSSSSIVTRPQAASCLRAPPTCSAQAEQVGGARKQEAAWGRVTIDDELDGTQQIRRSLHLVDDQQTVARCHQPIRVAGRTLEREGVVECQVRAGNAIKHHACKGRLADLACPRDGDDSEDAEVTDNQVERMSLQQHSSHCARIACTLQGLLSRHYPAFPPHPGGVARCRPVAGGLVVRDRRLPRGV